MCRWASAPTTSSLPILPFLLTASRARTWSSSCISRCSGACSICTAWRPRGSCLKCLWGRASTSSLHCATEKEQRHAQAGRPRHVQKIFGIRMFAGRFFNQDDTANSGPFWWSTALSRVSMRPTRMIPSPCSGQKLMNLSKALPAKIVGIVDNERQKPRSTSLLSRKLRFVFPTHAGGGMYKPTTIAMDLAVRTDGRG